MNVCKIFILFIFLLGCLTPVSAQQPVSEVTMSYTISVESNNENTSIAKSLDGALLTVYLRGGQSRSTMQSPIGTEASMFDEKSGRGFILKEYSGQKLMITMTKENWKQKNQFYSQLNFQVEPNVDKISSYTVKKAIAVLPSGKNFTVFYTPEIQLANKNYNNSFPQLAGVPVQFEIESGNLIFKYTLTNVSFESIPFSVFEIPRSGYRVMSYEDNQQLKKGDKK